MFSLVPKREGSVNRGRGWLTEVWGGHYSKAMVLKITGFGDGETDGIYGLLDRWSGSGIGGRSVGQVSVLQGESAE